MGSPVIFSGNDAKTLKPNIDLFGNAKILSGSVDPTSSATSAPKGSIYLNTSTGFLYRKTDAGSSTNWVTINTTTNNFSVDNFTGDGSTTAFTLTTDPGTLNNTFVFIGGVYQQKSAYSVSTTTLTFGVAPLNTVTIQVAYGNSASVNVPADGSVTTVKIVDANVTTAKIADANVTRAKLAAVGQQLSSSSGTFTSNVTTATDVTNLSVTITTTGRPVYLMLVDDGTVAGASVQLVRGTSTLNGNVFFVRGSTTVSNQQIGTSITGGTALIHYWPAGSFHHIDVVAAGTYTYKVQVGMNTAANSAGITVNTCKLLAHEL